MSPKEPQKQGGGKQPAAKPAVEEGGKGPERSTPKTPATLQVLYQKTIVPQMMKKFGYKNALQVPRIEKIVVNMGVGKGAEDIKIVEAAQNELTTITGQRAVITRAKKAISNFKIRENSPVGCRVTLRRRMMYEFLEKLVRIALPRVHDFRGIPPRGFDQAGNFSFGITEQNIFPEIDSDRITRSQGMDVTLVVRNSGSREESYELLTLFGLPFRQKTEKPGAVKSEKPAVPAQA